MLLASTSDLAYIPTRIVSLVPSQTELLHFLGLDEATVGITKFCVHPKEWRASKTIIGGTKNIHIDRINALKPDLVIANKEENVKEQVEALAKDHAVRLTDVNNLADALQMISDIGALTGTKSKATELSAQILAEFPPLPMLTTPLPTAYLIWREPFMTVGGDTFINDMLSHCGLANIFAHKKRYPETNPAELKEAGCKLLLLSSEPYPFAQKHIDELRQFLPATKILLVDGEMFSWYGSRLLLAPAYFKQLMENIKNG